MKPEDKYYYNEEDNTEFDATQGLQEETTEAQTPPPLKKSGDGVWGKVAVAGAVGLTVGGVATFAAKQGKEEQPVEADHPEWVDDAVPVAENVSDDMSFQQAFDVARAEVGSGGVFEWRGNIYSTFTEGEWDAMTAEEKAEYGSHFDWHGDTSYTAQEQQPAPHAEEQQQPAEQHHTEPEPKPHVAENKPEPKADEPTPVKHDEPVAEVEVLGVVHDDELDVTVGGIIIDGQEVALIDMDNDNTFDILVADVDGNGEISDDEIVDISDQNVTVADLGGMTPAQDDNYYTASDDQMYDNDIQNYDA